MTLWCHNNISEWCFNSTIYLSRILVKEFIELFEFLYPGHTMLANFDWSSNHAATASDALAVTNMNVTFGGERTVDGKVVPMPELKSFMIEQGDLGPKVPSIKLKGRRKGPLKVGNTVHLVFRKGDDPPFYAPDADEEDYVGKAIGMRELAYRLGWWKKGMTKNGTSVKTKAQLAADKPSMWQVHDLVIAKHERDAMDIEAGGGGGQRRRRGKRRVTRKAAVLGQRRWRSTLACTR